MNHESVESNLPNEGIYPKLIRDKIPAIIQADGKTVNTRILSNDEEYLEYLLKKVSEEAHEVSNTKTDSDLIEEIADLREVIDAILTLKGVAASEIDQVQNNKRINRGGFDLRLLMLDNES